jgi:hypothetical protein
MTMNDDNMMPAKVISYDRVNNVVEVQPLIKIVTVQNSTMSRHPLANIPVLSIGGGGYHINFPLKAGDLGWICAADRDISTFMETLQESPPNSTRLHDFGDSVFVPDVFRQYTISSEDSSNAAMVIQSTDSTVRIALSESNGQIKLTAPTLVEIACPQSTFTGNVTINQNLKVIGNGEVDGTSLTVGGVQVYNHDHTYTPGTGTPTKTSPMQD